MKNIRLQKNNEYLYPVTKDENIIRKENNFIKKLYTGLLVNGDVNIATSSVVSNSHRVVMRDNIVLPYMGVTLQFKLPENIRVRIYTSDDFMSMSGTNSDTNKVTYGWFKSGDTWTAKKEIGVNTGNNWQKGIIAEMQYRIVFAKFNNSIESTNSLSVSEIQSLIDEDKIFITYRDYSDSIITRNYANEANIRWAFTDRNITGKPYTKRLPAIAHVSDLHGDYYRWKNCMEYCDYLGIQAIVVSGDILAQNTNDGYNWFMDVQKEHPNVKVLAVAGNHDHDGNPKYWNSEILPAIADLQQYDDYNQDSGNWYTYVESINTHFVGLDLYRGGSFKPSITDTDLQYLKDYVDKVVSNGVKSNLVIVTHSSEIVPKKLGNDQDDWYSDMYTDDYMTQFSTYGTTPKLTNYLKEYLDSNDILSFRCLLTGHLHRNLLGSLYDDKRKGSIFEFKATIDNAISCNQRDSINGDGYGITQDNFSIYGFLDEDIRISRVGSIITTGGKIQDRVQLNKFGNLAKPWSNSDFIFIDGTVDDQNNLTINSNNAKDIVLNPDKIKILRIDGLTNIIESYSTPYNVAFYVKNYTSECEYTELFFNIDITGVDLEEQYGSEAYYEFKPTTIYINKSCGSNFKLKVDENLHISEFADWDKSELLQITDPVFSVEVSLYDQGNYFVSYIPFVQTQQQDFVGLISSTFIYNSKKYYFAGNISDDSRTLELKEAYTGNADLSDYSTTSQVQKMISDAINPLSDSVEQLETNVTNVYSSLNWNNV